MTVLGIGVVALAAAAGALLAGDGRSVAQRRLAALPPSAPAAAGPPRPPGRLLRGRAAHAAAVSRLLCRAGPAVRALKRWRPGPAAAPSGREQAESAPTALPLAVDLLVSGLRAGAHPTDVVAAVARALDGPLGAELDGVARRLRLGVDPAHAWQGVRGPAELAALGRAAARACRTGAPLADLLEAHAADCRRAVRARALELAQRTGVLVVVPLGLCFLPAFVLVGVVPLAAGLLSGLVLP
ncbi:type II secretion system F family protein [Thermobifida cellulosilytica]|uniref:Type II secretion system protein GspF domain-containing protein n=1 Tax=Thermobifida cellulosilytica TB100 TaxID=665004 RepID=A0A147KGQ0_THECS|nr:type II secretion system F family protein [Thermobifida cellulosilytica]KUP96463.1 hypothetical protein AC529_11910 [Thermobifida cellulosilytica TB100]